MKTNPLQFQDYPFVYNPKVELMKRVNREAEILYDNTPALPENITYPEIEINKVEHKVGMRNFFKNLMP